MIYLSNGVRPGQNPFQKIGFSLTSIVAGLLLLLLLSSEESWASPKNGNQRNQNQRNQNQRNQNQRNRGIASQLEDTGGSSQPNSFGLGIMIGEPSGISGKYWLSSKAAIDFGVTYAFGNYFGLLADYLWEFPRGLSSVTDRRVGSQLIPYVGVGAMLVITSGTVGRGVFGSTFTANSVGLAARVPLGIEFLPDSVSLGVFAELVPGLGLIPGMFGLIQGDIGVRFYF
jgi:hypothetical protein